MGKRGWMFVLLILLVLPMAFSAPPFVANPESTVPGLQITFPLTDFYPANENISLNFHIFNATNFPIEDDSVECDLHIWNLTGKHVLFEKLVLDPNDGDYDFITNKTILAPGIYNYLVNCNSSTLQEAGFVESTFTITEDGLGTPVTNSTLPLIIGLIAIVVIFVIIGIMLENIYLKLISLMMIFGLDILLWGIMLKIAEDILKIPSIVNLMNAGWPYVLYSHVVFIGLIFLFLTYQLLMTLAKINKAKY